MNRKTIVSNPKILASRRDDWHAYVGYVFQSLYPFVVNLAPNAGIGDVAER
jgi:hypothetical protein